MACSPAGSSRISARCFAAGAPPSTRRGALMVSSEGACAAYYQYRPEQDHPEEARRD
ncbi:hypothetical protein ACU6RQ_07750 [Zobellella denitrificans]